MSSMNVLRLTVLFCVFSVLAQVISVNTSGYVFSVSPMRLFLSALVSVPLLLIADITNERYGFRATLRLVVFGVVFQAATIALAHVLGWKASPFVVFIGLAGIFLGDIADALVYAGFRRMTKERLFVFRAFCSNTTALCVEAGVLFFIVPSFTIIASQFEWKFLASLLALPIIIFLHRNFFRTSL